MIFPEDKGTSDPSINALMNTATSAFDELRNQIDLTLKVMPDEAIEIIKFLQRLRSKQ